MSPGSHANPPAPAGALQLAPLAVLVACTAKNVEYSVTCGAGTHERDGTCVLDDDDDDDGFSEAQDCDDEDPYRWEGEVVLEDTSDPNITLTQSAIEAYCQGACMVNDWRPDRLSIDPGVSDLSGLSCLSKTTGHLVIDATDNLATLTGLENLVWSADLTLEGNRELSSLDGLSAFVQVRGDVTIRDNPSLSTTEIEAFLAEIYVNGDVVVEGNAP